jgi:hypothetical protein
MEFLFGERCGDSKKNISAPLNFPGNFNKEICLEFSRNLLFIIYKRNFSNSHQI